MTTSPTAFEKSVHFQKNSGHVQLFIPGPTEVAPEVLDAFATPQIGHRGGEFSKLYEEVTNGLRWLLNTKAFIFTPPVGSTGLWECAVRNLVAKRCLCISNGAFSARWFDVALANGVPADHLELPWGTGVSVDQVRDALKKADYDLLTIAHNETSTSAMNPIEDIARMVNDEFPETLIAVDAVSSMSGVPMDFDAWGLDFLMAGMQKCFALPAGMSIAAVSQRALTQAEKVENRGYLTDIVLGREKDKKAQTISTPSIATFFALQKQLERFAREGLEVRYERHRQMAALTHRYAEEFFDFYIPKGYRSTTVTAIKNTREIDIPALIGTLKERGIGLGNGYGKLKNETFRIGHMGEWGPEDILLLLNEINDIVGLPKFD